MKKYIVEALGAGVLTLVVGLSIAGTFPVATPVLAAVTLGLFVYTVGHISGTHINPAVTVGLWSLGRIETRDALLYIVAQFIGASVALGILNNALGASGLSVTNDLQVGFAELLGTAIFTFGIAAAVLGKVPSSMSGVVVGGSLLLGVALSALLGGNGVLNPAVAWGIGSFGVMYVLAPLFGAVVGMQAYRFLQNDRL